MLNPAKILHEPLQICPSHLSDEATLPWEIQSHFQHYYSYRPIADYLRYLKRKQITTVVLQL